MSAARKIGLKVDCDPCMSHGGRVPDAANFRATDDDINYSIWNRLYRLVTLMAISDGKGVLPFV